MHGLAWDKASVEPDARAIAPAWRVLACLLASLLYGWRQRTKRYLTGLPRWHVAAGSQLGAALALLGARALAVAGRDAGPAAWPSPGSACCAPASPTSCTSASSSTPARPARSP